VAGASVAEVDILKNTGFLDKIDVLAKEEGKIVQVRLIVDRGYLKLALDKNRYPNLVVEVEIPHHLNLPRMPGDKRGEKKVKRFRFDTNEVIQNCQVATHRVFNEIANHRVKISRLLQHVIPHQYVPLLDDFMDIAAGLANEYIGFCQE